MSEKITVVITDHTGQSRKARVDPSAPISQIRAAIIDAFGYPSNDAQNRRLTYNIAYNNQQLHDNETLASLHAEDDGTLMITPEFTAGNGDTVIDWLEAPAASSRLTVQPQIQIATHTLRAIQRYARHHHQQEIGGILYGDVSSTSGHYTIGIHHHLFARFTVASAASLTFTMKTWLDLVKRGKRLSPQYIVGWYHSHPGYGIFFSTTDEFNHRHFFTQKPWYLALVVDPFHAEFGFFTLLNGTIQPCSDVTQIAPHQIRQQSGVSQ